VSAPEPVIVGLAASVWPCGAEPRAASVAESEAFIEAYQHAARRPWNADQIQASWAAGLWVYAFNAKKASLDGASWLDPGEAAERLRPARGLSNRPPGSNQVSLRVKRKAARQGARFGLNPLRGAWW